MVKSREKTQQVWENSIRVYLYLKPSLSNVHSFRISYLHCKMCIFYSFFFICLVYTVQNTMYYEDDYI